MAIIRVTVRDTITERQMDRIESIVGGPIVSQSDDGAGNMFLSVQPRVRPTVRQKAVVKAELEKESRLWKSRWM